MPPQETRSTLRTPDGLSLSTWHYPSPAPRARVVLVHGYADHVGRYPHVIEALTGAGYDCHALDLRGHGHSEGVRGHVHRFGDYLEDLDLFLAELPDDPLPRFLFGHSLGGLLSLRYVLHRPDAFAALAVSSPYLHLATDIHFLKEAVATAASHLAPKLLTKSPLEAKALSHDPAMVEAYVADPLVFKTFNARWFFEARHAQEEVLERAGEIRLPVLFLIGSADPIAQPERSRQVFERLGSEDKTLKVYDGFLHEVLNEIGKEEVIRDLIEWLDGRGS
ncbi:MAG TPA: lysophospholipase [Thermoanaerobaculia bacterium]|nr:lysophospholipase [Thermoanaerobaculia bacterium]